MSTESATLAAIRNALGRRRDTRTFRNNIGTLQDKDGRYVTYGLCTGSGDLIGWRSIVIGPEHVGLLMARFLSIECKSATGRLTPEQRAWMDAVLRAGGLAGVARSVEDALGIVKDADAAAPPAAALPNAQPERASTGTSNGSGT